MACYLTSRRKADCMGCEACVQACAVHALRMVEDAEGFRYPQVDESRCVRCGACRRACPQANPPALHSGERLTFGGYAKDGSVRDASTSGGAFSAIAAAWCRDGGRCAVFGAAARGLEVAHAFVEDVREIGPFRKSKYLQSIVGDSYQRVREFLRDGRCVLFSGTPCQVAGLRAFLGKESDDANLLTVEVVCEGVPTPHFVRKFAAWLGRRLGGEVTALDYRFKDGRRWDFEVMQASLQSPTRGSFKWKRDRWFNPFWSIWLQRLMSRPSCGACPFARPERGADVTLGDLWGVHLYCPDLYGRNGGSSLVVTNTAKGRAALDAARARLVGRELEFADALRYQGPMRNPAAADARRAAFMADIVSMPYEALCRKWAKRPTPRLLFQKYVWGNRQKVWLWNLMNGSGESRKGKGGCGMINFTVGPVQSSDAVRAVGGQQVPYFRTAEFSETMLESERLMLKFVQAPAGARAVFMTASGTGSMEAAVVNALMPKDRVLVVNGGSFGHRFVELLQIHGIPFTEVVPPPGDTVSAEQLATFNGQGYTAFLVNVHETSTGVLHDIGAISAFCKRNGLLLVVDAISSFLADPFDMAAQGADVMITGSQKALACPPGVSVIVLSPRAIARVEANDPRCLYLDLQSALKNQERGQTPFTPAVGTLLQINARLKEIDAVGGVAAETAKIAALARYFRGRLKGLPFEVCSKSLSNAVTPLHPTNGMSAYDIFLKLKDEHGIWVCPNGGDLKDKVFRVGHLGALTTDDYDKLLAALGAIAVQSLDKRTARV